LARLKELKVQIKRELAATWQADAKQVEKYLLAAQGARAGRRCRAACGGPDPARLAALVGFLKAERSRSKIAVPWRTLAIGGLRASHWPASGTSWRSSIWPKSGSGLRPSTDYVDWADFHQQIPPDWQAGGLGLREGPAASGELVLSPDGPALASLLPAGTYTHRLSQRLNGRSARR
jgi:hypothetical protein